MGLKLSANGKTVTLSKEANLGQSWRYSSGEKVVELASGHKRVISRGIRMRRLSIELQLLHVEDRRLLTYFFEEVVGMRRDEFTLELLGTHFAPVQTSSEIGGVPVTTSTVLASICGSPSGNVQSDSYIIADRYTYERCRLDNDFLEFVDTLDEASNIRLEMTQEIDT